MAVKAIPTCPIHKQDLIKLSENSLHELWSCTTCNQAYQIAK